ncbi:hypothetical protein EJ05DRAFT_512826 [Pseudovirgaria hyperparasitica]|uniref:Uncharacterized protein n=1 Tax=Pseudovirgaria hyperparasitica TaxID=470096 RepID=A0A6A6VZX5_9PEZI|nr:uncharacterized protein EJ05DRAFT_512826 [Pseudovirgaria hyperparasitica]KAF2755294.1 hypothetical protein EJ05DRAFT_512826 [Pseudovirgaria hyperparasitica]
MKYFAVPQSDETSIAPSSQTEQRRGWRLDSFWWKCTSLLLLSINTILTVQILRSPRCSPIDSSLGHPTSFTGIHETSREVRNSWWTRYSAENDGQRPAVDEAWNALRADHGIVALPYEWSKNKGLPSSLILPSDRSKRVYILESYHMLHCLQLTRKSIYQMRGNEPLTYHFDHVEHCIDALRQHVMCNADDTLLYIPGNGTAGHGQTRQCKDWNYLSKWATKNTACFEDKTPTSGVFGSCDDGSDGLVLD